MCRHKAVRAADNERPIEVSFSALEFIQRSSKDAVGVNLDLFLALIIEEIFGKHFILTFLHWRWVNFLLTG